MNPKSLETIVCPACGQALIAGTQVCQFCGAATGAAPISASGRGALRKSEPRYSWQEVCYYAISGLWVVGGVWDVVQALGFLPELMPAVGGTAISGGFAVAQIVVGVGLLAQNDLAIFIARILTIVQIAMAALGIAFAMFGGFGAILAILFGVLQMALACFFLFLLNLMGD